MLKAVVIPEDELRFYQQAARVLSDRDALLSLLDRPPPPNEALRAAAARK